MLTVNHVPTGAVIGLIARRHPWAAFGAGVLSHLALDAIPHWGITEPTPPERFLYVARRDGIAGLAMAASLLLLAPRQARPALSLAMLGAVSPDLDLVTQHFFKRSIWPHCFRKLHSDIQKDSTIQMHQELTRAATGFTVAAAAIVVARILKESTTSYS
jgi:hypothetical protein